MDKTKILFFDIETVPMVKNFDQLHNVTKSIREERYSKEIDEYALIYPRDISKAKQEHWYNKSALFPEFGKTICITFGVETPEWLSLKTIYDSNEKDLITKAHEIFTKWTGLVWGFNQKNYDTPWLIKKFIKYWLNIPVCMDVRGKKPRETGQIDVMEYYSFGSSTRASLMSACWFILNHNPKCDIDGVDVKDIYYDENKTDEEKRSIIGKYCESDVDATWSLWRALSK